MKAKKSLGQNFLIDQNVISRILGVVSPKEDELVLEIGPGHGALTKSLVEKAGKVVAIELDDELIGELTENFSQTNLKVLHSDVLKVDINELIKEELSQNPQLKPTIRVVANLPYYISTAILTKLIESRLLIQDMVLMLQREVAERIASPPNNKDYGILSVISQLYFDTRVLFLVKPGSFRPVPKVDSAILGLKIHPKPVAEVLDNNLLVKVLCGAFSQRRKTILNNLKSSATTIDKNLLSLEIPSLLDKASIEPQRRAETLDCKEFALLANTIYQHLIDKMV